MALVVTADRKNKRMKLDAEGATSTPIKAQYCLLCTYRHGDIREMEMNERYNVGRNHRLAVQP